MGTAMAGRRTPGRRLRCQRAATKVAPEFPAETMAEARPEATSSAAAIMEQWGLERHATEASSPMEITSRASTISKRASPPEMPRALNCARMSAPGPTRITEMPWELAAWTAPSMFGAIPESPAAASRAIFMVGGSGRLA